MIGTRGIALVAAVALCIASSGSGIAGSRGPASSDKDGARAMFDGSIPADTIGLSPIWSLAVIDSGRRVEIVRNRFREMGFGAFPVDSIRLQQWEMNSVAESSEHMSWSVRAAVAKLRVDSSGEPESTAPRWEPPVEGEREPRSVGAHPPIPLDGNRYCLSRDGKFLLALRYMPHSISVQGETGHFGLLDYFDVSNRKRPHRIGPTLEADGPLMNGAVSDDGDRVAVAIIYPDSLPRNHTKVVVFERLKKSLSPPRVIVPACTAQGLQFEGRFLFVGMQQPPLSIPLETATTQAIDLYDLGK